MSDNDEYIPFEETATVELTANELNSLLLVVGKVLQAVPDTPQEFQRAGSKLVIARHSLGDLELDELHLEGVELLKEIHGL